MFLNFVNKFYTNKWRKWWQVSWKKEISYSNNLSNRGGNGGNGGSVYIDTTNPYLLNYIEGTSISGRGGSGGRGGNGGIGGSGGR